ncbi:TIGR02444 family protein [Pseudomonas cremoricolorata]|uniref:TIGR02444 family protein n=1 Tax=Pseudomonas cremoricolorata TaxID=157783 RepID=UPI000490464C|nr:TIGR02444 family protein [Pseudomonas cremoricolorata]
MSNDLWSYALALYGRGGVETAALALQEAGADVCLLLCGCWLHSRQVGADAQRADTLCALASAWQNEVIGPLRLLRQHWKAQAQSDPQLGMLREQLKGLELKAERTLLERLEEAATHWSPTPGRQGQDWLRLLLPISAQHHDALQTVRVAACRLQEETGF